MNTFDYDNEIEELAEDMVSDAMDQNDNDIEDAKRAIFDCMLHETIDSHQWIIYHSDSAEVLQHSPNRDAWESVFPAEDIGNLITEHGGGVFDSTMAYYAMRKDVAERVTGVIEQYETNKLT